MTLTLLPATLTWQWIGNVGLRMNMGISLRTSSLKEID